VIQRIGTIDLRWERFTDAIIQEVRTTAFYERFPKNEDLIDLEIERNKNWQVLVRGFKASFGPSHWIYLLDLDLERNEVIDVCSFSLTVGRWPFDDDATSAQYVDNIADAVVSARESIARRGQN
jgi:hypothetical protein